LPISEWALIKTVIGKEGACFASDRHSPPAGGFLQAENEALTHRPIGVKGEKIMANIVICADGTWNRPEEDVEKDFPTNVLKLSRAIKPSANGVQQHVFYDWGLGSYHNSISAGATGRGIHKNILDGYRYIVQNFAPKDKIYLFGFSRGAYTVRALSGLINNCGILKRPGARRIADAWKI
jgi:uncharacterized protein (DUF2235 family)